jgi:hypothetical protein
MNDASTDLLRELVAEVRGLRADLVAHRRERKLSPADRAVLSTVLPTIAATVGDRVFTVSELVAHAQLPAATELREAIATAGGAHALGRLLKRGEHADVGGLALETLGVDRDGRMWRIVVTNRRVDRAEA